ncbi:hypothetical protein [Flavobacterium sp. UMI-01]|uniref:hypothetical protein n=1 Tax=Flavobacterium sp. UMI-01 TaxID=1441053 RepID=UPI001C7D47E9|nr:hypothetical protein [Flavobacterium sp. UMI-01]
MKKIALFISLLTSLYLVLMLTSVLFYPVQKYENYTSENTMGLVLMLILLGYLSYLFTKPTKN